MFYFHKNESATKSFHYIQQIYGKNVLTMRKCKKYFDYFKRGNYKFEYDEKNSSSENEDEEKKGEEEDVKQNVPLEQSGTSKELDDLEEVKLIAHFVKHSNEIINTPGMESKMLSEKNMFISRTLLNYYNVKKNNVHASKSEQFLVGLYGNRNLAVNACKNLLKQLKSSIDFEYVMLPQTSTRLENLSETHEEVEVTPPIYFSHKYKILKKMKKCDCRIVKIRKVLVPSPKKSFLRNLLLHLFNMRETAYDCHNNLFDVYGDQVPSEKTCKKWFNRFKKGNFDLNDEKRSGRKKKFEDAELLMLLNNKKIKQSQRELSDMLRVTQQTISRRLKNNRINQK